MTKVKFELECLKKLLKRESIARFVDSLPDKATADLNYIYIVPSESGMGKRAFVLRPDRSGFDAIDLSSQSVNVEGDGYVSVQRQTTEDGVDTFTVTTNESLSSLLTQLGDNTQRDAKIEDVRHRVEVLENRPESEHEIQTLSLSGTELSISSGNSVTLPTYNDTEVKTKLSKLDNDVLSIKASGGSSEPNTLVEEDKGIKLNPSGSSVKFPRGDKRYPTSVNGVKEAPLLIQDAYKSPISVLTGKKIYFVGDSLTEVNYRTDKGYVESLKADKGISAVNQGTSGLGYSTKAELFMGKEADSSDAFVIALGVNDFGDVSGKHLKLETVLKYAKVLIGKAVTRAEGRPVGVILPMHFIKSIGDKVGEGGYTLTQLSDGIKRVCKELESEYRHNISVLDLTSIDPLDVKGVTDDNKSERVTELFTQKGNRDEDLLHPNDKGWELITPYIAYWMEKTFTFISKKDNEPTLQVIRKNDGSLEINSTTTPFKYDSTEENSLNRGKFRIPVFGDGSHTFSLNIDYTESKKYNLTITVNDSFTFSTKYHPHANEFGQMFFYFDVDSITTEPKKFLKENTVKSVMESKQVDEKEARYILNLIRLYQEYLDRQVFDEQEKSNVPLDSLYIPFSLKINIEKV